jgi:Na+/melibiose symporter-like transporter
MSIVPAGLLLAAIAFAWKYPISREKHLSLLEQLEISN